MPGEIIKQWEFLIISFTINSLHCLILHIIVAPPVSYSFLISYQFIELKNAPLFIFISSLLKHFNKCLKVIQHCVANIIQNWRWLETGLFKIKEKQKKITRDIGFFKTLTFLKSKISNPRIHSLPHLPLHLQFIFLHLFSFKINILL